MLRDGSIVLCGTQRTPSHGFRSWRRGDMWNAHLSLRLGQSVLQRAGGIGGTGGQ